MSTVTNLKIGSNSLPIYIEDEKARQSELFNSNINLDYILRDVIDNHKYNPDYSPTTQYYGQSLAFINNSVVIAFSNYYNDYIILKEYNLETKELLRESGEIKLGHANSMVYDPDNNVIVVSPSSSRNQGVSSDYKAVFIVNYNDFSTQEITLDYALLSISRDPATNKWYGSDETSVYTINRNDWSRKLLFNLIDRPSSKYKQGIQVYNNIFININSNRDIIDTYNIDGELLKTYTIEDYYTNYKVGELEQASFDSNGNLYILSTATGRIEGIYLAYVFKTNIYSGAVETFGYTNDAPTEIYVDQSFTGNDPDGSSDKPFPTITEALNAIESPYTYTRQINIRGGNYNEAIYISNNSISLIGSEPVTVKYIALRSAQVFIQNITADNENYNNGNYALSSWRSDLYLTNVTINGNIDFISNISLGLRGMTLGNRYSSTNSRFIDSSDSNSILPGMSFTDLWASGCITNDKKEIRALIPFQQKLNTLASPQIDNNATFTVRGVNGYILNNVSVNDTNISSVSFTRKYAEGLMIYIKLINAITEATS